ncbi:P-loop containing nucleoside triphosphate hydrolase protein [Melanogaster broomeanus]|nr:P-loop containing nucleoside triphosphate hydrolase protein [Melanogaster broomeanus]
MSTKLIRNVVVAGETGVGKSSFINLVLGSDKAKATNDVRGVTLETACFSWEVDDTHTFRLWDTPGLGEGTSGSVSPKRAQDALRSLFTALDRGAGVHLLIVCMRGISRIIESMKQTYDAILAIRNKISPATRVIAVITELEKRSTVPDVLSSMEKWWKSNAGGLSDQGMEFSAHACITTVNDDCHPPIDGRRSQCRELVRDIIRNYYVLPRHVPSKDLQIMLFGETGVGKSSLVNLLAGEAIADVSPDSVACTMHSKEYQFHVGPTSIRLWDTVGLEEPEKAANGYVGAIEKAIDLIQRLNETGGISLFLFFLGKKQVPIALAVTHLEGETEMEKWWNRNVKKLEKSGIVVAGHACLTTLEDNPKYSRSREACKIFSPKAWIGRLLKGLRSLAADKLFPKAKDLTNILTKRCHLDAEVAQRVAACIDSRDV